MADEAIDSPVTEPAEVVEAPAIEKTRANEYWKGLSGEDREAVIDYAQKGWLAEKEAEEAAAEPAPEPEPAKEMPAITSDDKIAKVLAKMEKMEAAQAARDQKDAEAAKAEMAKAEWRDFNNALDKVLDADELFGDESADNKQEVKDGFAGLWMRTRPTNTAGAFKEYLLKRTNQVDAIAAKKHKGYVKGKLRAKKETPGEKGGGSVPASEAYRPSANDLNSGDLAERIKERLGV